MSDVDFWDSLQNETFDEPPKMEFSDLPEKAWVACNTATQENGGAAPQVVEREGPTGPFFRFKIGLQVFGGDDKIKQEHIGKFTFFDASVHKNPDKKQNIPCGAQLYNFMLDTLAPTDEPVATRWAAVRGILAEKGKELGQGLDDFHGDRELMIASTFAEVLKRESYPVLAYTMKGKKRANSSFDPGIVPGQIAAYTVANIAEHKVEEMQAESAKENF